MTQDSSESHVDQLVTAHYDRLGDLRPRVRKALAAAGGDPGAPDYAALHLLDQFHLGGAAATRGLADWAGLRDMSVLDIGCGIGGPARCLAQEYGCNVTGVDLTESYVRTARSLSAWTGLDAATRFTCASALALPLADAAWPVAFSQHAIMNIPDKRAFYAEAARVLAPGGLFVHHDIVAGPVRRPHFPVPWAETPAASFLVPVPALHGAIRAAGLVEIAWRDMSATALA